MKTVVLLGVLVLLLLFLNWRNPTEHMTLVKGIPVVGPSDAMALQVVWVPDPVELQKEIDTKALIAKGQNCASNKVNEVPMDLGHINERVGRINEMNSTFQDRVTDIDDVKLNRVKAYMAKYNC